MLPFEEENLSATQQLNEYIMTSLRTVEGLDLNFVKEKFGQETSAKIKDESTKFLKNNHLILTNNNLILTTQGKLFADGIAADLFF